MPLSVTRLRKVANLNLNLVGFSASSDGYLSPIRFYLDRYHLYVSYACRTFCLIGKIIPIDSFYSLGHESPYRQEIEGFGFNYS